jgi:hypothetical protein
MLHTEEFDTFVIIIKRDFELDFFLKKFKVKANSYAASIIVRLVECFTKGMVDLEREYRTYYEQEYSSLWAFLYKKINLDLDLIDIIRSKYDARRHILGYGHYYSGGDYNIGELLRSQEVKSLLIQSIEELNNEN